MAMADIAARPAVPGAAAVKVMHNDLLVKMIGERAEIEDLQPLRSTCSLWNHSFIPSLRDKQRECVKLYCGTRAAKRNLASYVDMLRVAKEIPFSKFHLVDVDTGGEVREVKDFFPLCGPGVIRRLDLETIFNSCPGHECEPINIYFYKTIILDLAMNLVDLRLIMDVTHPIMNNGPALDQQFCGIHLRSLKKLQFCVLQATDGSTAMLEPWGLEHKNLLADLLRGATGLKTFSTAPPSSYTEPRVNNSEALSVLSDHLQLKAGGAGAGNTRRLTILELSKIEVHDLELLLAMASFSASPLRLVTLAASLECRAANETQASLKALGQFLESQSDTLRHFKLKLLQAESNQFGGLGFPGANDQHPHQDPTRMLLLPVMPAMTSFRLERQDLSYGQLSKSLERSFPHLAKFEYFQTGNIGFGSAFGLYHRTAAVLDGLRGFGHSAVRELSLDTNLYGRKDTTVTFLGGHGNLFSFHLLTRLELKLKMSQKDTFTEICGAMHALEDLSIIFKYKDSFLRIAKLNGDYDNDGVVFQLDSLLTGISKSKFGHLQQILDARLQNEPPPCLSALQHILEEHKLKTKPGLQDLGRLKRFQLDLRECFPIRSRLTDIGGYFGLLPPAGQTLQQLNIKTKQEKNDGESALEGTRHRMLVCEEFAAMQLRPPDSVHIPVLFEARRGKADVGLMMSRQCQTMIRKVMAPPAIICLQ